MTPLDWLEDRRQEIIDFAAELVATPSPNPPGDERAVVQVILERSRRLGLDDAEVAALAPHRPNVIYRLRGARPGPVLMLGGHSDTKPVGDRTAWLTDPLVPVIRDGKLCGLGSTDMKGAVAAMIYATAALANCNSDFAGELLLVIDADEEAAMKYGSQFLCEEFGLRADAAILGEPSGIDGPEFEYLHLVSRGISCFMIRVFGTQMHSSLTDRLPAVNANLMLAEVLTRLRRELRLTFQPHPLCSTPTVNLGVKISGGVGFGVCPGVAQCQCDIRTLPGMTREQLRSDIESCLDAMRRADPRLRIEFEFQPPPLDWLPPSEFDADHPLVGALVDSCEHVVGRRPKLSAFPGGTDAANYHARAGIPTISSFGPGWLPLAHGPNECVGTRAIVQAAKIYASSAQAYLRPGRAPSA